MLEISFAELLSSHDLIGMMRWLYSLHQRVILEPLNLLIPQ